MRLSVVILTLLICSACAIKAPKPTPCSIYSKKNAVCTPSDPGDPTFDKPLTEMRGYMCFSPDDTAEISTFIKKVLKEFDNIQ